MEFMYINHQTDALKDIIVFLFVVKIQSNEESMGAIEIAGFA